ncbi:hypothetical protein L596_013985 [Steinernema carpocapsae]|uniref:Uncharacterized protein n=1 Tax=Steinernema carpocapsae TaxID=34508 RepID=A0A4U5NBQ4_STECR|nr:hypothetical protein L596_013985 [Steinernema carpocapsae]
MTLIASLALMALARDKCPAKSHLVRILALTVTYLHIFATRLYLSCSPQNFGIVLWKTLKSVHSASRIPQLEDKHCAKMTFGIMVLRQIWILSCSAMV